LGGSYIEVVGLTKRYNGGVTVGPITLSSERGLVYGLIGPNGSGKTTTIRCMLGLQRPSGGRVCIAGLDPVTQAKELMGIVGYSQELPSYPPFLAGVDIVKIAARLRGLSGEDLRREVERVLDLTGLVAHANRKVGGYSKGMLQRLSLAQALVGDPEVLILDEPMLGVDPAARIQMREIFLQLKRAGKTILFSTHELYELERVADKIGMIYRGRIVLEGGVQELLSGVAAGLRVEAEVLRPDLVTPILLESLGGVRWYSVEGQIIRVEFAEGWDGREALSEALVKSGAGLVRLETARKSLEGLFMEVVAKSAAR